MWQIGILWKLIHENIVWNEIIENLSFQKLGGGLTGLQLLEGVAGKEWVTCFREYWNLHLKNKSKSEIFNDKKSL